MPKVGICWLPIVVIITGAAGGSIKQFQPKGSSSLLFLVSWPPCCPRASCLLLAPDSCSCSLYPNNKLRTIQPPKGGTHPLNFPSLSPSLFSERWWWWRPPVYLIQYLCHKHITNKIWLGPKLFPHCSCVCVCLPPRGWCKRKRDRI